MKTFVAFLAVVAVVVAFEYDEEFDQWTRKYGKSYDTDDVRLKRQIIWESNMNFVQNHNKYAAKKFGFTVEMNEFADLETSEFKEMYNGYAMPEVTEDDYKKNVRVSNSTAESCVIDWVEKGAVTAIKNQGRCGSCWAFSTTGSLEGQHFIKTGDLVSLSEQQLMDCSTKFGNHGCKGGLMDNAFRYLATIQGDDTEATYPYKAEDSVCKSELGTVGAGTKGHQDIPRGDEAELRSKICTVGPISCAMDAGHKSFQLYHSGIYRDPECSSTKLDHGVLAVGLTSDAYKMKNSWGTTWGMEGYFLLPIDEDNMCGVATQSSHPTIVD